MDTAKQTGDIIQTENGPVRRIEYKAPYAYYATGVFALLYACFFSLYSLWNFTLFAGLCLACFFAVRHFSPTLTRTEAVVVPPVTTGSEVADELLKNGKEYLAQIKEANRQLPDAETTAQLDRIQNSCEKIFDYLAQHPEKAPDVRKFMNYYLPTLVKLLQSEISLEQQGVEGQNITATKKRITDMLGLITKAFETQQDQLFADERIDVSAEISVLESMMKQQGLLKDEGTTLSL